MSLLLDGQWYECNIKQQAIDRCVEEHGGSRAVSTLDVQVLNDRVLRDVLGIENVRTSSAVDFVGGSRGLEGLVRRCQEDSLGAFALHPCNIN